MLNVQMYSYKGGSGRTVATANISSILARKGFKVLVIDLDVESAGMSYIFKTKKKDSLIKVQDIITDSWSSNSSNPKPGLMNDLFSLHKIKKMYEKILVEVDTNLFFIPARYGGQDAITWETSDNLDRFLIRLRKFQKKYKSEDFDFVLYDSPSGLQEWARKLFRKRSCSMVIFFRWSKQFTKGTIEFLHDRFDSPAGRLEYLPPEVLLVPNAVPGDSDTEKYKMVKTKENYVKWIRMAIDEIKLNLKQESGIDYSITFDLNGIPECPVLKWDEKIVSAKNINEELAFKAYDNIANKLIEMKARASK